MSSLVKVQDLRVIRGGQLALEVESLEIARGELLAVVGPNGAGKSTLLLALARLLKPDGGRITFDGRSTTGLSDTQYRRRIALVMQEPLLFDDTVFSNVAAGLLFRGMPSNEIRDRVTTWLDRLGVGHLSGRRASELSGGEARRVSLARALVLEPELLLLDEPFSALDPPTRKAILDDFSSQLANVHSTTLLVTHDLEEARRLADRVAVLIGGRLRQVARLADLAAAPVDEAVRAFLH